jgi:ABC-type uncharacterized transport system involved in gliding motility auxiliary subunit
MTTPVQSSSETRTLDLAVLGTGALATLLLGAKVGMQFFPKVPTPVITYTGYAGFGFMALFALLSLYQNRRELGAFFGNQRTQSGGQYLIQFLGIMTLLVVLNWMGTRYHKRFDLTSNHAFSISDQSKKVAREITTPLKITAFVNPFDQQGAQLKDLMREYGYVTDKLTIEMIDPQREPGKVQLFFKSHPTASRRTNVAFVENGSKLVEAQSTGEQDLTAALIKATQTAELKIYIVQGHGEAGLEGFDQDGMSQAKETLTKQGYVVEKLNLFTSPSIPADAHLVVVPGPRKPFLPGEVEAVSTYASKGGRLVISLVQGVKSGLEPFLASRGIEVQDDIVLDPRMNLMGDLATVAVQQYGYSPITDKLNPTIWQAARSLALAKKNPDGVTLTSLVETSDAGFGKVDLSDKRVEFNPATDHKGPVKLAIAADIASSSATPASRMVVFGASTFFSNGLFGAYGNGDLFLNSVNWTADQDKLVSIPSKPNVDRSVNLTGIVAQSVWISTIFVIPGLLLALGGFVFWRRRLA